MNRFSRGSKTIDEITQTVIFCWLMTLSTKSSTKSTWNDILHEESNRLNRFRISIDFLLNIWVFKNFVWPFFDHLILVSNFICSTRFLSSTLEIHFNRFYIWNHSETVIFVDVKIFFGTFRILIMFCLHNRTSNRTGWMSLELTIFWSFEPLRWSP